MLLYKKYLRLTSDGTHPCFTPFHSDIDVDTLIDEDTTLTQFDTVFILKGNATYF